MRKTLLVTLLGLACSGCSSVDGSTDAPAYPRTELFVEYRNSSGDPKSRTIRHGESDQTLWIHGDHGVTVTYSVNDPGGARRVSLNRVGERVSRAGGVRTAVQETLLLGTVESDEPRPLLVGTAEVEPLGDWTYFLVATGTNREGVESRSPTVILKPK